MNIQVLLWKWGLPGCDIQVVDDIIVTWDGCQMETAPTGEEYEDAEVEYDAYLAAQAIDGSQGDWIPWTAPDLDAGVETLVQWDAPSVDAAWKWHGRLKREGAAIGMEGLLHLTVVDGVRMVNLTVQHTATAGDVSGVKWVDVYDALYSDYDAGTGKIRLRVLLPSDNWSARGKWQRLDILDAIDGL